MSTYPSARLAACLGFLALALSLTIGCYAQTAGDAATDACVKDPTSMACASFALPDAEVNADLDGLCTVRDDHIDSMHSTTAHAPTLTMVASYSVFCISPGHAQHGGMLVTNGMRCC